MMTSVADRRSTTLVSVGMPTFNGARFIEQALRSLLAQSHGELEIVVSDNASTDPTAEIVQGLAQGDHRIRYVRQPTNIGAARNFDFVRQQASASFFMWAGDDDWWEPTYVARCLAALEARPDAALAASRIEFVNGDSGSIEELPDTYDNLDLTSPDPARRVLRLLSQSGWYQIYGLMRRSALDMAGPFPPGHGGDVIGCVRLAAHAPFVLVPERLFHYRTFTGARDPDRGPNRAGKTPYLDLVRGCLAAVGSLPPWQRLRVRAAILTAVFLRPTTLSWRVRGELRGLITRRVP